MRGFVLWRESVVVTADRLHKATIGAELSPLFLGVGFLIGPRIAATMLAGGVLGWTILIPLFDLCGGSALGTALGLPASLADATASQIWSGYVRYVGAGAVTAGGLAAMVRAAAGHGDGAPPIAAATARGAGGVARTDHDLPRAVVLGGVAAVALGLWLLPPFQLTLVPALLAVVFAFFFVVVSGRIVGLVGTTSQPVSGMTITALLAITLCLVGLGERGPAGLAASITAAAIVAIAIALAGDMAQDLKTGALLGATPRNVQIGEMIGVCGSGAARRLGALPAARRLYARLTSPAGAAGPADGDARVRRHARRVAVGAHGARGGVRARHRSLWPRHAGVRDRALPADHDLGAVDTGRRCCARSRAGGERPMTNVRRSLHPASSPATRSWASASRRWW